MRNITEIADKLSLFNNITMSLTQWNIVLKGCGCPNAGYLKQVLRERVLKKTTNGYTLTGINQESFAHIWEEYCTRNRASVQKVYDRAKAKAQAREACIRIAQTRFKTVDGVIIID